MVLHRRRKSSATAKRATVYDVFFMHSTGVVLCLDMICLNSHSTTHKLACMFRLLVNAKQHLIKLLSSSFATGDT